MQKARVLEYRCCLVVAVLALSAVAAMPVWGSNQASFQGVGFLTTGTDRGSEVWAVSADGSVLVGWSRSTEGAYNEVAKWTAENGTWAIQGLGSLSPRNSTAIGVSRNGAVIVGWSENSAWGGRRQAFRWTEADGIIGLNDIGGTTGPSGAMAVAKDGSVIGGYGQDGGNRGAIWKTVVGNPEKWPATGICYGITDTGTTVISVGHDGSSRPVWYDGSSLRELPRATNYGRGCAEAVTSDGQFIVGQIQYGTSGSGDRLPSRWTRTGDTTYSRETLSGAPVNVLPLAVTDDGSIIVGSATGGGAFIWDGTYREMKTCLEGGYGLDLSGWTFSRVRGISDDGRIMAGTGVNPDGRPEGWVAMLTTPYVTNVTSDKPDGAYTVGEVIDIQVTFNEKVAVTGTPQLELDTGSTNRMADWILTSVDGTVLTFRYTVQAGDYSADLDYAGTGALSLNAGTIRCDVTNKVRTHADLTLPVPGTSGSLSANKNIVIDTVAPTVTIDQATGQADPTSASPINFTAVFSKPVVGFTDSDVTLSGTAGATTAVVTGGPAIYNVAVSGMTASGTVIVDIPAGVAEDAAGNLNEASTSTDNEVTYVMEVAVIGEIKKKADGESVTLFEKTITAFFLDHFYIEETDRSSGIMVIPSEMPSGLTPGDNVNVSGTIETNSEDERYIDALLVTVITSNTPLEPDAISSKALGGEDYYYDPLSGAGQKGVEDGEGENTIGRLVRLTGEVTAVGGDFFYITDGYGGRDFSLFRGVRVQYPEVTKPQSGTTQSVSGISKTIKINDRVFRTLRPRSGDDIIAQS